MIKYFIAALAISLSSSTFAISEKAKHEMCLDARIIAGAAMQYRQNGVPETDAMQVANGDIDRQIVEVAYGYPVRVGKESKQSAIENYRQRIYNDCVKQLKVKGVLVQNEHRDPAQQI